MKFFLMLMFSALPAFAAEMKPIVIAHRGASGYLPEHTLPAKALAYGMGADFLEQDLVLTRDDVPIVLHDIFLDSVTDVATRFPDRHRADGRYYALDFTWAEIKSLRVTERFNPKTGRAVFAGRFPANQSEFHLSSLEEELQFIQGLNHSTGRRVGIYPEIKQPTWHRKEGHDLSAIALPILARYGYRSKADLCWLQCFDWEEVQRLRSELGWKGRLVLLLGSNAKEQSADGETLRMIATEDGFKKVASVVDGIGPGQDAILKWSEQGALTVDPLVARVHAAGLGLHPYTVRKDALPKNCPSLDALHAALFNDAHVEGTFTDFTDLTLAWLRESGLRP